jgi:hypothetical protein
VVECQFLEVYNEEVVDLLKAPAATEEGEAECMERGEEGGAPPREEQEREREPAAVHGEWWDGRRGIVSLVSDDFKSGADALHARPCTASLAPCGTSSAPCIAALPAAARSLPA